MSKNNWKKRDGIVYSTNPEFEYESEDNQQQEITLPPQQQKLIVRLDKKARKGKAVTLVSGFVGTIDDLSELGKYLKLKCGVGGSVKDNEILIQGNQIDRVSKLLEEKKYKVKVSGK